MLPVETVLRIWDTVFYEGSKILFRVAIGLLKLNKERLLAQKDFAALIEEFKYIVDSSQVRFYIRWKKEKAQVKLLFCLLSKDAMKHFSDSFYTAWPFLYLLPITIQI